MALRIAIDRVRAVPTIRAILQLAVPFLAILAFASRASAAGQPQPELRLPADAVFDSVVGADRAVIFRHPTHVALTGNRCIECHPRLYRILSPTVRAPHSEMNAGRSCGACHDGVHAFGVKDPGSCATCHVGRAAATSAAATTPAGTGRPAARGPDPISYASSEVSPGPVLFRHSTHAGGNCAACHPGRFAMKSSAAHPRDGMHEVKECGGCHDGKHAFNVEDEKSCDRCHHEKAGAK